MKTKKLNIMNEVECPYCEKFVEINHDDGFGYEEGVKHEMECKECGKTFVFTTAIIYSFESEKAECLNGGEHDYELTHTHPIELSRMRCKMCDRERELTDEEREKYKIRSVESYLESIKSEYNKK